MQDVLSPLNARGHPPERATRAPVGGLKLESISAHAQIGADAFQKQRGLAHDLTDSLQLDVAGAQEAGLKGALVKTGNISEAKSHYQRALRLNPSHALAHENLQELEHRQVSR